MDAAVLTVGIKHTSSFSQRRLLLAQLLRSIRLHFGAELKILVADDGGQPDHAVLQAHSAQYVPLPSAAGLSFGRNALVHTAATEYIVLLDDDVLFDGKASLHVLLAALRQRPAAAIACGCTVDIRSGERGGRNLRLEADEGGADVRAHAVPDFAGCQPVHVCTEDYFVARTRTLQQFGWDPRQKMFSKEGFFYQLFLNEQTVLACAGATALHNTTRDDEYREQSLVNKEARYAQFLCKDFPELSRLRTPYMEWRCDTRTYCVPDWQLQFAYDGAKCNAMHWSRSDRSVVSLPLVSRPVHPTHRFPVRSREDQPSHRHVPLLVLILTERRNTRRREWQRATWLSFPWHTGHQSSKLVPWRYLYVLGRRRANQRHESDESPLDRIVGDTVTLSAVREGYGSLIFKTMEALRWALAHSSFELLLKTDDDSIVHVGRAWQWLVADPPPRIRRTRRARIYAGRVVPSAQVIRANFSRRDLWHPDWFPADFAKWAVAPADYPLPVYPPYCAGGGYVLGNETASLILSQYDRRRTRRFPVEDAFVGVLANASGISPVDVRSFRDPPRGSHQARKLFIDQILVHRVAEPYKAFRWLMLTDSCFDAPAACAIQLNRTHGRPYRDDEERARLQRLATQGRPARRSDWANGEIPDARPDALTGMSEPDAPRRRQAKRTVREEFRRGAGRKQRQRQKEN
jgi:hypothetical protein